MAAISIDIRGVLDGIVLSPPNKRYLADKMDFKVRLQSTRGMDHGEKLVMISTVTFIIRVCPIFWPDILRTSWLIFRNMS